jgi:hypothetical protein
MVMGLCCCWRIMVVGGGDGVGDENKCKKYVEKLQRKDTF